MKIIFYLLLTFTSMILKYARLQSVANVSFGPDLYNVKYNSSNPNCDLLKSSFVSNSIKCLILCQSTLCKSLTYSNWTKTCILNGSSPDLILYDSLPNLDIKYNLGNCRMVIYLDNNNFFDLFTFVFLQKPI